jgi:hypothetical protein
MGTTIIQGLWRAEVEGGGRGRYRKWKRGEASELIRVDVDEVMNER